MNLLVNALSSFHDVLFILPCCLTGTWAKGDFAKLLFQQLAKRSIVHDPISEWCNAVQYLRCESAETSRLLVAMFGHKT